MCHFKVTLSVIYPLVVWYVLKVDPYMKIRTHTCLYMSFRLKFRTACSCFFFVLFFLFFSASEALEVCFYTLDAAWACHFV